jgi:hypothetical protein
MMRTFALCLVAVAGGCSLSTMPATTPMCIAQDAYGREVQCSPPPETYEGDRCTCMLANTREVFVGRVRDLPGQ